MEGDLNLLRKLDRLITSDSVTVTDLLEQAMVAAEISDEDADILFEGPLSSMYNKLLNMQHQLDYLIASRNSGMGESNPYQNITWTSDKTYPMWKDGTGSLGESLSNITWNPISQMTNKTTNGTGT